MEFDNDSITVTVTMTVTVTVTANLKYVDRGRCQGLGVAAWTSGALWRVVPATLRCRLTAFTAFRNMMTNKGLPTGTLTSVSKFKFNMKCINA